MTDKMKKLDTWMYTNGYKAFAWTGDKVTTQNEKIERYVLNQEVHTEERTDRISKKRRKKKRRKGRKARAKRVNYEEDQISQLEL